MKRPDAPECHGKPMTYVNRWPRTSSLEGTAAYYFRCVTCKREIEVWSP